MNTNEIPSSDALWQAYEALPEAERRRQLFLSLVMSMQSGAMIQMGKIASPQSGKIERDLMQARMSIDTLDAVVSMAAGNLTSEMEGFVSRILSELRMNFVDEQAKTPAGVIIPPRDSGAQE